nr:hypothetical protein [Ardenticatena sp.]
MATIHLIFIVLIFLYIVLVVMNMAAWRVVIVHARHTVDIVAVWVALFSAMALTVLLIWLLARFW